MQRGVACIPKSVTPSRIQQNLQVFDFSLSEGDMKLIESLNLNERFIVPTVVVSHKSRHLLKSCFFSRLTLPCNSLVSTLTVRHLTAPQISAVSLNVRLDFDYQPLKD